ncbi:ribosomal-processing cysteine protease Prp [Paenibacillus turpanensis]|uniref:ribosomal-processing cysteine protease Prp n=1 Tax=Paenibacillus turpanensis TaxID=2689078 RepID=UPI00140CC160
MIRVTIHRNKHDRSIDSFTVEGHADYAEHGKDIVCAGVTAVTFGTVNAAEAVVGAHLDVTMADDGGYLRVQVPIQLEAEMRMKVQLQLESMVVMLESIRESYGSYMKIQQKDS